MIERCRALPDAPTYWRLWGRLLVAAGMFDVIGGGGRGDHIAARGSLEEAYRIGLELDDPWVYLTARAGLTGIIDIRESQDLQRLAATAAELLAEARRVGHTWAENRVLVGTAVVALRRGDFDSAQAALEQATTVARRAGDAWSLAMTLVPLGDLERSRGNHARAGVLYRECLERLAEIGLANHALEHPYLLHNLGYVALAGGDPSQAYQRFLEASAGYRRVGDNRGGAECLIGLGATAAAEGRAEVAIRLFAAGEAALAGLGAELWHSNRPDYQRWRDVASARLTPDAFDAAWKAGRALSFEEAITAASRPSAAEAEQSATAGPAGSRPRGSSLTPRERDVARLVVAGLTNRQIGQTLVITEKTAANHVQRVLDKLGLHSRAALAARSAALGLDSPDSARA